MKIYLAGPMAGYPNFNFPAFHHAARLLRLHGNAVFNPAERDHERDGVDWGLEQLDGDLKKAAAKGFDRGVALADDLTWICTKATAIAMLPGWEKSSGATAEYYAAKAFNLTIIILGKEFLLDE